VPNHDAVVIVEHAGADIPPRVDEAEGWVSSLRSVTAMLLPGVGVAPYILLHVFDDAASASEPR
jgi:hypothetical protein